MDILSKLKAGITDPATLALVLRLIMDLTDGSVRLDASTRLELQAELDSLTGGLL